MARDDVFEEQDDTFDQYQEVLQDFRDTMETRLSEIHERSRDNDVMVHVLAPHAGGGEPMGPGNVDPENFPEAPEAEFHARIDGIVEVFERWMDGNPTAFDGVVESMQGIGGETGHLSAYTTEVPNEISAGEWDGTAASNFRAVIVHPLPYLICNQLGLAREILVAAQAQKEVMQRGRAHMLDIATKLRDRLVPAGGDTSLGDVVGRTLWIASAVVAAVSAVESGGLSLTAWHIGNATLTLQTIRSLAAEEEDAEPPRVAGEYAQTFIPSAEEEMYRIRELMYNQDHIVSQGMNDMLSQLDRVDYGIVPGRPQLADTDDPAALGRPPGDVEEVAAEIGRVKLFGAVTLPALAYQFEQARVNVADAKHAYRRAVGDGNVIYWSRQPVEDALENLYDAIEQTRDYLYAAGQSLVSIADNYAATDADNAQLAEAIRRELEGHRDEYGEDVGIDQQISESTLPRYEPPTVLEHGRPF